MITAAEIENRPRPARNNTIIGYPLLVGQAWLVLLRHSYRPDLGCSYMLKSRSFSRPDGGAPRGGAIAQPKAPRGCGAVSLEENTSYSDPVRLSHPAVLVEYSCRNTRRRVRKFRTSTAQPRRQSGADQQPEQEHQRRTERCIQRIAELTLTANCSAAGRTLQSLVADHSLRWLGGAEVGQAGAGQSWVLGVPGRIFDDRGNRMSPSHSRKGSTRHRYYVSSALIQGQPQSAGFVARVPAAKIEAVVLDLVPLLLKLQAWRCIERPPPEI
jgi:hypothetical protein